jgi:hypothetical protein
MFQRRNVFSSSSISWKDDNVFESKPDHLVLILSFFSTKKMFVFWILNLLLVEVFFFHVAFLRCRWPLEVCFDSFFKKNSKEDLKITYIYVLKDSDSVNVIMIADPQLTDLGSYSWTKDRWLLLWLIEYLSDLYMTKCFRLLQLYQFPSADALFMLGDLFDSGRVNHIFLYDRFVNRILTLSP